jgi:hypothetical protein
MFLSPTSSARRAGRIILSCAILTLLSLVPSAAQTLNGTYTIGAGGNYASISAAVTAINSATSVTGPVTMYIRGGTITPPTTGWSLPAKAGMSTTNRITFKPYPGETVVISGPIAGNYATFDIRGSYYTIDGTNGNASNTSRDLRITQTDPNGGLAIRIYGNADGVHVRNSIVQSGATSYYGYGAGNIQLYGDYSGAPDDAIIESNTIGDSTGTLRAWIMVHMYGGYSYFINNPIIRNNVIVNGGNNYGIYYNSYVIAAEAFVNAPRIEGNAIHYTSGASNYYHYGIAIFADYGYVTNAVVNANRINVPTSTGSQEYTYPIYIGAYGASGTTHRITNNFISNRSNSSQHYTFGFIQVYTGYNSSATIDILHNTMYSAGSGNDYQYGMLYNYNSGGQSATVNFRNNLYYSTRTSGGFYHFYMINYGNTPLAFNSSDNLIQSSLSLTYYLYTSATGISTSTTSLATWQASGYDQRSFAAVPNFVDAANGDLHIDASKIASIEGRGFQASVLTDIDGNLRATSPYLPDIGADEGNFNGGGLKITYPTAGANITSNYLLNATFTANRPMNTRLELSTNNGATWTQVSTVAPTLTGSNLSVVPTPDVETNQARLRVVSNMNPLEADTSAPFNLVRPIYTVVAMNGGESLVPTDTVSLRWSSQFAPPTIPMQLDVSVNGGATWQTIASNLTSLNLPATNAVSWIVPNTPTNNALVRIKAMGASTLGDSSNATFKILPAPVLTLTSPVGGDRWFVGEKRRITWDHTTVFAVRIEYTTDGGGSWRIATVNTDKVPASHGGYDWTVPDEPSTNAMVRITSVERPRFNARSSAFSIIKGSIALDNPVGGEQYELGQTITAAFRAPTSSWLDFRFSSDGGATWSSINPTPGVPVAASASGTIALKLPSLPTQRGLLRVVDVEREWLFDETDATIEIMEAPTIAITSPALNDQIERSTMTNITWMTNRVTRVNIDFSANGGAPGSYVRLASNFDAALGTMPWQVPGQTTPNAKIRFTDMSGVTVAESGTFAIVDAAPTALHLDAPNGGETYAPGDRIVITWTGVNVPRVMLRYSSDGGASWNPIATDIPAINRRYEWTAPSTAGERYRISISSSGPTLADMSDNDFSIVAPVEPSLGLVYPSGGETLYVGDTVTLSWAMQGIAGPVGLMYTVDDGTTWKSITTLAAGSLQHSWIVPDEPTLAKHGARLQSAPTARIMVGAGTLSDTSLGFSIERRLSPSVEVTSPNLSTEMWTEGTAVTIRWDFQVISNVDIMLSTDDGATWGTTIVQNASAALQSYTWNVPHLADTSLGSLRVRVSANPGGTPADDSDVSFGYRPSTSGVADLTGMRQMMLFGNFPNPFATTTELRWRQSVTAPAILRIYNQAGSLVFEETTGVANPGDQRLVVSSGTMPNGVYLYELRIAGETLRSLMTITR